MAMASPRIMWVLGALATSIGIAGSDHVRAAEDSLAADEALVKEAGVVPSGPGLLAFFRKRSLTDDDRRELEVLVRRLGSPRYKERLKAFADLLAIGSPALPFVRAVLNDPDLEISKRAHDLVLKLETGPLAGAALPA